MLEETNDIGFAAVRVGEGKPVSAGVYFRMALGGITGHQDFARDAGVLLKPEECVPAAAAVVRVFIENGARTDRRKARLKYVLDRWGLERYIEETEKQLPSPFRRLPIEECEPRTPAVRGAHIGFHPQRQPGLVYVGVVLPVGRMSCDQMRGLAAIADCHGTGTIRLTVWQNLLISDVPEDRADQVKAQIEALGLGWKATEIRTGHAGTTTGPVLPPPSPRSPSRRGRTGSPRAPTMIADSGGHPAPTRGFGAPGGPAGGKSVGNLFVPRAFGDYPDGS